MKRSPCRPGRAWLRPCEALFALVLIALLVLQQAGLAQEAGEGEHTNFAGLTIVAAGEQEFDLLTGVTTLPQGGQIISQEYGLTLVGERIAYREGEFIEASGVSVTTDFADATAESVRFDLESGDMSANGNVRFEHETLSLRATSLRYIAVAAAVRFEGPVVGEGLEAAGMLLDIGSGTLLLVGPYRYEDGLFELASAREGALLALTPANEELTELRASTDVDPGLLERLAPHLP